jgi:hypothetical protein
MLATDAICRSLGTALWATADAPPSAADERDELVELMVLAEHGDTNAAGTLQVRLDSDPAMRAVSDSITLVVDAVRVAQPCSPVTACSGSPMP